jgi:hypothetical protein
MPSLPIELDTLHLAGYDEKKGPTTPRLTDVTKALAIYSTFRTADEKSSINRARIDAMFDGAPPFDTGKMTATNQSQRVNLNFNQALRLLDISLSAFVDLYSSLETFVEVRGTIGEVSQRMEWEGIVAREITHMLRNWPEFHGNYLRLCTTFIKHGVGVAFFDSPEGWKFRVGGFQDILIPRQSNASEASVDVAVGRRPYLLHELYDYIKDETAAKSVGWNVDEVKRVLACNMRTTGQGAGAPGAFYDYEALQAEFKNNDIYTGIQNPAVHVLHFWVREADGSVSHLMAAEDQPEDFLYKKISRFASPEQAYIFFTYGVGTNGTYHSVRGLGQRIFSHIQTSNRLRCQQIEGAMLASQAIIQPENQRALDELAFTSWGPFAVLSPGATIVEKAIPNLGNAVRPALDDLTLQLELNTDTVSTYGPQQSSPYKNQTQVVADMDVATRLSGATLNLFYSSWNRLIREITRRIITMKVPDAAVKTFRKRCMDQGVPEEFFKSLDLDRTRAVRSIGGGSYANRLVALRELQGISGQFDETGRKHLIRDIVATRVGHDLADRYVPELADPRPTIDVKIAMMENQSMMRGEQIEVITNELHGTHLEQHLPVLQQLVEQFNTGEMDPMQSLPIFEAFYTHVANHAQEAAADATLQGMAAGIKKLLNFAEEIIHNMSKAVQKMQREQMEQEGANPQETRDAITQTRIAEHQTRMAIAKEKAELEMELKQQKWEQERALADARNALKLSQQGAGAA